MLDATLYYTLRKAQPLRKPIRLPTLVMHFIILACVSVGSVSAFQETHVVVSPRAARIHNATFVFDGHNDLPYTLKKVASSSFVTMDIAKPQPSIHTDIPRLLQGNVGAQYWSCMYQLLLPTAVRHC